MYFEVKRLVMNECIDIALTGAKLAASNNTAASIFVHGLSAGYNIGQMGYYRYRVAEYNLALNNGRSVSLAELNHYKRELAKHTFLSAIDIACLFIIGFGGRDKR